ncbi:hypothetical protein [Streptomyces sp. NPDC086989]|uniref:hypothetical protein n=1 Tax=Streptomyces sp. NPDC086989 TaxID=3365764 RepID=UPI0038065AA9
MTPYALAAPPPFVPDNCQNGPGDWSAVGSASAMSAFCGIFAGFVFAGVVVVIGEKNPPGGDGHASRGLRLLLPCFFGLAAASYLYALASGELVCLRATTEQLFSGAILAADAVVVIAGLAWLLPAYQRNRHGEVHFFRGLVQFAAQFSVLMLIVSSIGFDNAVLRRHASPWSDAASWVSGAALMLLVLLCWWRPVPGPPPPLPLRRATGGTRPPSTAGSRRAPGRPSCSAACSRWPAESPWASPTRPGPTCRTGWSTHWARRAC